MNTNPKSDHDKKTEDKKGATPAAASTKPMSKSCTHDGKIVSVAGNKLVSTCEEGKQHSHTVASDAKVTCDGAVCKTEDLKAGAKIRGTTKPEDKHTATKVESLQKHAEFAKH